MSRRGSRPSAFEAVPWNDHREAALALLSRSIQHDIELASKVANFLGSCCGYRELTPRMTWWLELLLRDAGLPPLAGHDAFAGRAQS